MTVLWPQWQSVSKLGKLFLAKIINLTAAIIVFSTACAFAEAYLSAEEAMKDIFPDLKEYKLETRNLANQELKVFTVMAGDKTGGWSVVIEEMGKVKPITFLVGIDAEGKALAVYVLEYRDMFGSEIKRRSFLRQFKGKSIEDPVAVGRDIDAVTQATISSQAAATAVKKSLEIIRQIKRAGG